MSTLVSSQPVTSPPVLNRISLRRRIRRFPYLSVLVLLLVGLFALVPLYWMVASAFKSTAELAELPVTLWPHSLTWEHFGKVFESTTMMGAIGQTLFLAVSTTVVVIVLGSCAAYAVAQLKFSGRSQMLGLALFTQLLPQAAVLVPIFIMWSSIGLINKLPGLTLVYVMFQLPVAVWILTGHFSSVPREVTEAAAVDGAGKMRTLVQIVMPMAAPGVAAVAIWCIIGCWSEFLFGLVLLNGRTTTVTVTLAGMIGEHSTDMGQLMAGATIATLPPLLLFILLQKYFTKGIAGAVKG